MPGHGIQRGARTGGILAAVLLAVTAGPTSGQVDPSGSWRTWRTEHFRVHAHAGLEPQAQRAAGEAERAYRLLATELPPPRGTIDLVVADNVDFSNGYASVFPSNRLTVYLPPPTGSPSLGFYDHWLRLVLVHELTHLFHLDRADGVWGVLQHVFGRAPGLFPNVYQPSWVAEGLATYYESRFSTAGRARGWFHRAVLAAAAQGSAWPGRGDVWLTTPAWPAGHRPYAWGTEFFRVTADEHGDSVVPALVNRTSGQLWPFAVSRPLSRSGAVGVQAGWRALRDRAESDADRPIPPRTILERGLRVQPRPRVSPDGTKLAYVRNDGRSDSRVVVRSTAAWIEIGSHRVNGSADIAWLGDTLFVVQREFTSPVEIRADLFRWLPGGSWKRVTHGARLDHPFATPDGTVGAVDIGSGAQRVVTLAPDGWRTLSTPDADAFARVEAGSGGWLAAACHRDGRWDIVAWPSGSPHDASAITDDLALDSDPVWSADGRVLWYASEREGFPQVYGHQLEDGRTFRATDEPTGAMEPAPGADGSIFYSTLLEDGYALARAVPTDGAVPWSPRSEAVELEAAPDISLVGGEYQPWAALVPRYWVPWWHDEGHTGVFLSALTSGEDPIGRTAYVGTVGAAFAPFRWEAALEVVHSRWKQFRLEATIAQRWDGYSGVAIDGTPVALGERERRVTLGVGWRWRRMRSSLGASATAGLEHSAFFDDLGGAFIGSTPTFVTARLRAFAAHASSPAMAISSENGVLAEGSVERRWALSGSAWSYELRGSVGAYLAVPLPGFAHWVLAARVEAGRTGGSAPDRLEIGGASGDALAALPGLSLGSGRHAFALRGYPRSGTFTRAVTSVVELRIPVAVVARGWGRMPAFLDRISVNVFGEIGGGWSEGEAPAPTALRDVGGEVALDVGLIRDFPLRLRGGLAIPLRGGLGTDAGSARGYVVMGSFF